MERGSAELRLECLKLAADKLNTNDPWRITGTAGLWMQFVEGGNADMLLQLRPRDPFQTPGPVVR